MATEYSGSSQNAQYGNRSPIRKACPLCSIQPQEEADFDFHIECSTALAQPTPDLTLMAFAEQLRLQAPHSMQRSASSTTAFPASRSNTLCGQTIAHRRQPVHLSTSSSSVATFFKYCCPFMYLALSDEPSCYPQRQSYCHGDNLQRHCNFHFLPDSG